MQYLNAPIGKDVILSPLQKIKLGLFGKVLLGYSRRSHIEEQVIYYAFNCPVHGLQMDYPHGHDNVLSCPECLKQQATELRFSNSGNLININKTIKQKKSEESGRIYSKNAGLISKNKTLISVSLVGFMLMLIGYEIYKKREK